MAASLLSEPAVEWQPEGDAFVGVQSSFYWSATEPAAGFAWYVALDFGDVLIFDKTRPDVSVWPVRGGQ